MNTRSRRTLLAPHACGRAASRRRWAGVLMTIVITIGLADPAPGQDPPATAPAAADTRPALPPGLAGVAGVKPGMTRDQYIALAREARESDNLEDAQKILLAVAKQDPKDIQALQLLAQVYELRAEAEQTKADRGDPNAKEQSDTYLKGAIGTYLYAAPIAATAGALRMAEEMYNRVLSHDPANEPALAGLVETARLAMDMNNVAVAERLYRSVLVKRRTYAEALLGLARLMRATDRTLQAQERYKEYTSTPQGQQDSQAFLELGRLYRSLRLRNLALSTLVQAEQLDKWNPAILIELAGVYQEAGAPEKARKLAEAAIDNAPDDPANHQVYARILLGQNAQRIKQVQAQLATGAAPTPGQEQARQRLLDDLAKAKAEAQKAVTLAVGELPSAPGDVALLTSLNGYYGTCRQVLTTILSVRAGPGGGQAAIADRIELAQMIRQHAAVLHTLNLHQALATLTAAGEQARNDVSFLENLAQLQFEVYKREAAAETCRRLLDLNPDNAVAKGILDLLSASGDGASPGPGG